MLKVAWSDTYAHPLPEGHRFPMEKYILLPQQLLYEGTLSEANFFVPQLIEDRWFSNTHDAGYLKRLEDLTLSRSEIRAIGFPLSRELVEREKLIVSGSVQAALYALEFGIGMNVAGGTHHAFSDRGEGFCLLNDIAVTADYLIANRLAERVLVIDLDVHQGNGTAEIFRGREDAFTLSIHGEKNYPHRKEQSHLDIGVRDGTGDSEYLTILEEVLPRVFESFAPDFIIYQCGVDVLSSDKLGRLSLTQTGLKERDRRVLMLAKNREIPVMCCMGGGYSKHIRDIVEGHAQVFRLAQDLHF